jgi:hypothetical protein
VVRHSPDYDGGALERVQRPGQVLEHAVAMFGADVRLTILGAEDEVDQHA